MARGGAGLTVIKEKKLSHEVGSITDDVVVKNYFTAKSPIMTGLENRISFASFEDKKPPTCSTGNRQGLNIWLTILATAYSSVLKNVL